jgi:hypothetical protein
MTPQETFNALMEGKKVKLKTSIFENYFRNWRLEENKFWVYQIEASSISLYDDKREEIFYDFTFEDLIPF